MTCKESKQRSLGYGRRCIQINNSERSLLDGSSGLEVALLDEKGVDGGIGGWWGVSG